MKLSERDREREIEKDREREREREREHRQNKLEKNVTWLSHGKPKVFML